MGEVAFERFSLDFTMMKYVMTVDVNLRYAPDSI